ncbi:carboxylic ester hydrolase [Elysia marginata]|uniref:Carboxylic ester hydrolase n=1 Tax=Elysia marginata TaxID=1093978 RepID=A0AAV4G0T8_9GAST|nr:carboxylic ester hydrolase [Elysia marginata]
MTRDFIWSASVQVGAATLLLFSLVIAIEAADSDGYVTVSTRIGSYKGHAYPAPDGGKMDVFYGIPYAIPPVGQRRFRRPRVMRRFAGVQDATKPGNVCMQQSPDLWDLGSATQSEDCLNLNIYRPRPRHGVSDDMPVMVYVHGGNFKDQTSGLFNFTNLALKGVIVVTVNYRLDVFGFLSTQDRILPGNYGLLDVRTALRFIQV